jgi:hypothetical protein
MTAIRTLEKFDRLKPGQAMVVDDALAHNLWGDLKFSTALGWSISLRPFIDEHRASHTMRIDNDGLHIRRR